MNNNQKKYLRNWTLRKRYKFKKGGEISLQTILDYAVKYSNPSGLSLVEYMSQVHPYLYFNFLIDWSRLDDRHIPAGFDEGVQFGLSVIKDWQNECWEQKFYNSGLLSNYDNISQLREVYDQVVSNKFLYAEGFQALEERLYEVRQSVLDKQAAEREAELSRLEAERQAKLAEDRVREAQKIAEEKRRQAKAYEAEQVARNNRQNFSEYQNPSSEDNNAAPSKDAIPATRPTLADVMPEQLRSKEVFGASSSAPSSSSSTASTKTVADDASFVESALSRLFTGYSALNGGSSSVFIRMAGTDNYEVVVNLKGESTSIGKGEHLRQALSAATDSLTKAEAAEEERCRKEQKRSEMQKKYDELMSQLMQLQEEIKAM